MVPSLFHLLLKKEHSPLAIPDIHFFIEMDGLARKEVGNICRQASIREFHTDLQKVSVLQQGYLQHGPQGLDVQFVGSFLKTKILDGLLEKRIIEHKRF